VAPPRPRELAPGRRRPACPGAGRLAGDQRGAELVEVELHQKARPRLLAALKTRPPHTARVTYYVPAALHTALSAQLARVVRELGGRPEVAVEPLPQVPGLGYLPVRGGAA
jgi:hypothetical protein